MSEDNADYGCSDVEIKCAYCGSTDVCLAEYDIDLYECNVCGRTFIFAPDPATEEKLAVFEQHEGTVQAVSDYVRPLPCVRANGKTFEKTTLREWLAKLHEEMTEMEEKAFGICGLDDYPQKEKLYGTHIETEFALECADVATVLASMQEAFGIDLEARNEAQRRVNQKNFERRRL